MIRSHLYTGLFLALTLGFIPQVTRAQTIPAQVSPGAIQQQQQQLWAKPGQELLYPNTNSPSIQTPSAAPKPAHSPIDEGPTQPPADAPPSDPAGPVTITPEAIILEGNTVLPKAEVDPLLTQFKGQAITFETLSTLAESLTARYREAGYVNSEVYIPEQAFDTGTITLQAREVHIGEIRLAPQTRWFGPRAIMPRLRFEEGDCLNIHPIQQSLNLLNTASDLYLKAQLVPGQHPDTTDVILNLTEQRPYHVVPFWDNLGRTSIGNFRYGATVIHNNLLGFGDTNAHSIYFTKRSLGISNQYVFPIGAYGTQVAFDYSYSTLKPGGAVSALDVVSSAKQFTVALRQPLVKNTRLELNSELAFDFKILTTNLLGDVFNRDRLSVLRPNLNATLYDRWGRTNLNAEVGIGLLAFGATRGDSPLASKTNAGSSFLRLNGGVTRIQKLPWNTLGSFRGQWQFSPNRLLTAEQMQVGGAYSVRGYPEGFQLGDTSYTLSAEWYLPVPGLSKSKRLLPFTQQPLSEALQWVVFADIGQVFTTRPIAGEHHERTVASFGAGLRLKLTDRLSARLDLGIPVVRYAGLGNDVRLHFGLQSALF